MRHLAEYNDDELYTAVVMVTFYVSTAYSPRIRRDFVLRSSNGLISWDISVEFLAIKSIEKHKI